MAAPMGNNFWKLRTKHGRDRLFSSPEVLWEACCEYFEEISNNPLEEDAVNFYQGIATHEPVKKMRAMTLWGLYNFLGIVESTWKEYGKLKDFSRIIESVEQIIKQQKFEGAASGFFNANIIARDLGLIDKHGIDTTVKQVKVVRRRFDGVLDEPD